MKIRIGFFALFMFFALLISNSYISLMSILAAACHEAGHIIAARLLGIGFYEMRLGIFGAQLRTGRICGYREELLLAAAGPLANFLSLPAAFFLLRFFPSATDYINLFILSSVALGIMNLLPVRSLDGGRIFICLFSSKSPGTVEKVLSFLSFLSIFTLWCISLYLLLRFSTSLSLFIFSLSLFAKIFIDV